MTTIKDVAKKAGVSIATVSYCINNKKKLSPETQNKVKAAIQELNYVPNYSARILKITDSEEIGVILPNLDESFNSEILKGIMFQANDSRCSIHIACSYNNPLTEQELINDFISKNYKGIILMTCQSQDTEYFKKILKFKRIRIVFIMRLPLNISANFVGFNNYDTFHFFTKQLFNKGYSDICIVVGSEDFFSEHECINGYTDALDEVNLPLNPDNILYTDLSKEGAFKETMLYLGKHIPQAIISSSPSTMEGILEACSIYNIDPASNICLLTLAEERWNKSYYHENVIHSAATAVALGEESFKIIKTDVIPAQQYDQSFKLFRDNIVDTKLRIPNPVFKEISHQMIPACTIRIASVDLTSIQAVRAISQEFTNMCNIDLQFDFFTLNELFQTIDADIKKDHPTYDLYLTDVSWLHYFLYKNAFLDLTDMFEEIKNFKNIILPQNLINITSEGHYYGFPIVGGTQFLFYRKDLFNDSVLKKQYMETHTLSLRPPKTWSEFNRIAQFFTKSYNPASPTEYGTAFNSFLAEDFMTELLVRLWGSGGSLFNKDNVLEVNTPENIKAYKNILETSNYAPSPEKNDKSSFELMGSGQICMAVTYTEYASKIKNSLHPELLSRLGYCMLPGNCPTNVGWQFCASQKTKNQNSISLFFNWLCQKQTSYYQTILCGQSTLIYPHSNNELLHQYPWLELTQRSQACSHNRNYPILGKEHLIIPADFEKPFINAFYRIRNEHFSISDALDECQKYIVKMFN